MKKLRIFDPEVIKYEDYFLTYPELKEIKEFASIPAKQLMFVWYMSNPTSPLEGMSQKDKTEEALNKSGYKPSKTGRADILRGVYDENTAKAMHRMAAVDPGARYQGYKMITRILKEYDTIIKLGSKGFIQKTIEGSGENKVEVEEIDYQKFVNTSAKIVDTIPIILKKLEEGFSVSVRGQEADDEDNDFDDEYFMNKM